MAEGVRFIRKNGRVIPIRSKKGEKSPEEYRNLKLYGKGVGVSIAGAAVGNAVVHTQPKISAADLESFKIKYSSDWKKAGNPRLIQEPLLPPLSKMHTRSNLALPKGRLISMSRGNEAVFAHELGHLVSSRKRFSANRLLRKAAISVDSNKGNRIIKLLGFAQVKPYLDLATEAEATGYAFKKAFQSGGLKKVARFSKVLVPAYASYALTAAGSAMASYAVLRAVKDARNRGINGKSR